MLGAASFDDARDPTWVGSRPQLVPAEFAHLLAPARLFVYEWTDYWLRHPGAEQLRVGSTLLRPVGDLFPLRLENRLGLTQLEFLAQGRPLGAAQYLEVLSPKFPTIMAHCAFLGALLEDLFARAVNLPFTFSAPTGRGVTEASRPPTPLFLLHFLLQHATELRAAWETIQARPYRALVDRPDMVRLADVSEADPDVLVSVFHHPDSWVRARGFLLADRLRGHAPTEVWQRQPLETADTPENRFVRDFLRTLLALAERLPVQPWWPRLSTERQNLLLRLATLLRRAIMHPLFSEVGPMQRFPGSSQVMMRREGYRQMLALWHSFQHARHPLFGALQHAIDVRDVATLYETWAFFTLVEEIGLIVDQVPSLQLSVVDSVGLEWQATASFGIWGYLVYNRRLRSYSVPLRPDFLWMRAGKPIVALDAKFRLERRMIDESADDSSEATARRADLYKMHTYRDALGVRAAVIIYPGHETTFFGVHRGHLADLSLRGLLLGDVSGIGMLAMSPMRMG